MPNSELTVSGIQEESKIRLGGSATGVDIELDNADYAQALKQTLRLYNRNRPIRRTLALTVTSAQKKYPIDHPGLVGVLDVQFVSRRDVPAVDPFDPFSVLSGRLTTGVSGGLVAGDGTFGDLAHELSYQEDARRVLSAESEWKGQWDADGKYYLYMEIPETILMHCSYTYAFHVTPTDDPDTGLSWIPDSDTDWVMDYIEALLKVRLGRIRGKHHGVPGPDGSPMDTDYAELVEEGRADKERLEEAIKMRRRPLSPAIE